MSIADRLSRRNLVFLAIFLGTSLVMGTAALRRLPLGTPSEMGPGFFPLMLAATLGVFSLLAVIFDTRAEEAPVGKLVPLRAALLILGAPLVFALCIERLGLVPAVFLSVLFSTFASLRAKPVESLLLSAGFTVFCVGVFVYLLNLPLPLWGSMVQF